MLKGSIVALVTPFREGRLDLDSFENLIQWQIDSGTQGIVVCGSTGEGLLLSYEEQKVLVETAVRVTNKRITVIAAAAGFEPETVLKLCLQAEKSGADCLMVVTPPYIKPTQEALYQYYAYLHDKTSLPLVIYNNPGRAGGIFVNDDTLCRLVELPRIVGVKDSTGCLIRPAILRGRLGREFRLLCGDDPVTPAFLAQGGDGAISVIANVVPKACAQLHQAWFESNIPLFSQIRDSLTALNQYMMVEPNPIPIKYAVAKSGRCAPELRAPLLPLDPVFAPNIDSALAKLQEVEGTFQDG